MNKASELYRSHRWAGRTLLTLLVLTILLVTARALLPLTVVYSAERWLRQQGVETQIKNIDIGIYDGEFILFNAHGRDSAGHAFRIDRVALYWDWRPLRDQTFHIEGIELEGIAVDTFQYSDGFIIAGIRIDTSGSGVEVTAEEQGEEDSVAWAASLKEIVISELNTCYAMSSGNMHDRGANRLHYCVQLDSLRWEGDVGFNRERDNIGDDDLPLKVEGDFELKNLVITDRLLDRTALSVAVFEIDTLDFEGLASFGSDELTIENMRVLQDADGIDGYDASVSAIRIEEARMENLSSLSIGSLSIENPAAVYAVDAGGQTRIDPWLPAADSTAAPAAEVIEPDANGNGGLELFLNDIQVSGSNLCYSDEAQQLDYCLKNDSLKWNGVIRYGHIDEPLPLSLSGTLTLRALELDNRALSRDLVRIDRLVLNDLAASGMNARLAEASISDLQLMQLQTGEDRHAAGFDNLVVEGIDYDHESSAAIDSVLLAGLHAAVRKEKDGAMSYEEWLPAATQQEKATADGKESGRGASDNRQPAVRIGSIRIRDSKSIQYTDLTTSPEMDVGLNTLNLQLQNVDSTRPEQKSPLKLSAKTSRHGTIDIEGTIQPFDEQISFDATGRVNGLDLRAISPLTQQQIGHIIRSGQLNADLKLLAKKGQLDSNIELTLQHFQLKPVSENDAQELNKTFGMPVTQSLKLLRARDDSISLEIPVTGDLANPSFDPMDAIITATTKATTFTLITFYTPYGLAYAGGNLLFDLATAMRFEPVKFDTGNGELNDASREQLDKLAKLMKERPQIRLTFCGKTGSTDRDALFPPGEKEKKTAQQEQEAKTPLTPEQLKQLRILADTRQQNAKDYLVEQKQIAHDRLVLCAPEYDDSEDALSGIEINI